MKYYVITPAKNEEKYIALTLESMIHQTLKPVKWIIVDDGSTDGTIEIVKKYQKEHDWIDVIGIDNKQEPKLYGSKVIRAFNLGYNMIKDNQHDFIVKLDADLSFPDYYFREIASAFAKRNKLGICAGYVIEKESDLAKQAAKHTYIQGPIKSVRSTCFNDIGGFVEANGWDGLDQLQALYKGWEIANIPVVVIHHRTPTTEYRSLQFFFNNGIAHYRSGNDLFLTIIRSIVFLFKKPYILASISYFKGYIKAAISREPKLVDKGLAKFIRAHHYQRLLNFKR